MSPEDSINFLIDVVKSTGTTYTPAIRTVVIDGPGDVESEEVSAFLVGLIKSTHTRYTSAMRAAAEVALGRASQG